MRVYIASFFDSRDRIRPERDQIWSLGYEVVSSWLDEVAKPVGMSKTDFWRKMAIKDIAEVNAADILILDTIDVNPRGGREVEYGFALGCFQTKQIFIVGPVRNVFHTLADQRFESWDDCISYLRESKNDFETVSTNETVSSCNPVVSETKPETVPSLASEKAKTTILDIWA